MLRERDPSFARHSKLMRRPRVWRTRLPSARDTVCLHPSRPRLQHLQRLECMIDHLSLERR